MAILKYRDPTTNEWKPVSISVGDTLPVGSVIEYPSDKVPDNWLLCNGQTVSRTIYSELFNVLGTTWGTGDGSTTFNLPSKLGLVTVGKNPSDTSFNTLGKKGGEKTHKLTVSELASHTHGHRVVKQLWTQIANKDADSDLPRAVTNDGNNRGWSGYVTGGNCANQNTGGDTAHNNLQPYVVSNFIIKAKQSSGLVADVVNNLTSTSTTNALSANQGKVLNDKHTAINVQLVGDATSSVSKIDSNNKISIPVYRKGCCVGQSTNSTTKPWYKFASCTVDVPYNDRNIIFNVYQGYNDSASKVGILIAHFRTNSSKVWESGELRWLIKTTSIPASDFVLAHSTTAPCIVELWCKCSSTYTGYHFDVISEGARDFRGCYWAVYDKFSAGSQDSITAGYTQITSVVNKQHIEINTRNTTDTWIPVLKSGELQYTKRVLATSRTHSDYNNEQDRIPTLGFLSYWTGAYNSHNSSNLTYCLQGEIQAKPTTLYNNASGTKGTVTLSQNVTNFAYLDIFYLNNNGVGDSYNRLSVSQNGNYFILSNIGFYLNSGDSVNGSEIRVSSYKLSGNTITVTGSSYTYIRNKAVNWMDNNNNIYIYKVIGYK